MKSKGSQSRSAAPLCQQGPVTNFLFIHSYHVVLVLMLISWLQDGCFTTYVRLCSSQEERKSERQKCECQGVKRALTEALSNNSYLYLIGKSCVIWPPISISLARAVSYGHLSISLAKAVSWQPIYLIG